MNQDRNRDQDVPNRQSNMEPAEGSRESGERGQGSEGERNGMDREESRDRNSGGISNRPLDRERSEQHQLPDRGQAQSDR
jgi:hypothetical protein